jgi:CubicO group peptidase (beta-lactamase class C family)
MEVLVSDQSGFTIDAIPTDVQDEAEIEIVRALESQIPAVMRAHDVPGLNVAIALRGRMAWEGAYGFADAKSRRPMKTDTVFHSGSIAKPYAAVAIMQLAENGLLLLDDPVNRYLPFEVINPLGGPTITVRHLLTHSSGLGGDIGDSYLCDDIGEVHALSEVVEAAYRYQVSQAPIGLKYLHPMWTYSTGEKMQYSNLGVATLGLIVERVNKENLSYSNYIQTHIFDPLGMCHAQIPIAQIEGLVRPDIWDRLSTGYQTMGGAWIPTARVRIGEFPSGGALLTPGDYLRLLLALLHGGELDGIRILSTQSVQTMLSPAAGLGAQQSAGGLGLGSGEEQGMIWRLRNWTSREAAFWHLGGYMFGWQTIAVAYPHSGSAIVMAVNHWNALSQFPAPEIAELEVLFRELLDRKKGGLKDDRAPAAAIDRPIAAQLQIEDLNWKASYLRGLLFTESYRIALGVPQLFTEKQLIGIAEQTEWNLSARQPAHWDSRGFIAGAMDLSQIDGTIPGIRKFVSSKGMKITLEEARALYLLLGAHQDSWATLGGLLSVPSY